MTTREQSVFCAQAAARLELLEQFMAKQVQTNLDTAAATKAVNEKLHLVDSGLAEWALAQAARVDGLQTGVRLVRLRLFSLELVGWPFSGWRLPRWLVRFDPPFPGKLP